MSWLGRLPQVAPDQILVSTKEVQAHLQRAAPDEGHPLPVSDQRHHFVLNQLSGPAVRKTLSKPLNQADPRGRCRCRSPIRASGSRASSAPRRSSGPRTTATRQDTALPPHDLDQQPGFETEDDKAAQFVLPRPLAGSGMVRSGRSGRRPHRRPGDCDATRR